MKPDFLTRPEAWTRTGSTAHDPVAYAAAIQAERVYRYGRIVDFVILALALVTFVAWLAWVLA
jgi:L-arabinose isomerase